MGCEKALLLRALKAASCIGIEFNLQGQPNSSASPVFCGKLGEVLRKGEMPGLSCKDQMGQGEKEHSFKLLAC